jgi:hypothetical protein
VETYADHNLIVNGARSALTALIAEQGSGKSITRIGFGLNNAIPTPADTGLVSAGVKDIGAAAFPTTGTVEFAWSLATGEANSKAISEFGLLFADGMLFARKNRNTPIHKEVDLALEGEWVIIF